MKSITMSIMAVAGLMTAGSALAVEMPADGKAKCGSCHAVDKRMHGPSFMDISLKYKGDKEAVNKVVANVTKGGAFGWNMGNMPAKGIGASDAQIKSLSEFIVNLTK